MSRSFISNALTGPYMLVPIRPTALVVNRPEQEIAFQRWHMSYQNLSLYDNPMPKPNFSGSSAQPDLGIILHWALPAALTRGLQDEQADQMEFKQCPNRWLVVRTHTIDKSIKAWVLESDYLDKKEGTSAYLTEDKKVTRIGRAIPLDEWQGDMNPTAGFLTAVAPFNPYFSAFTSTCDNVFSFYDKSLPELKDDNEYYSYQVIGWYANAADDPLAGVTKETWIDEVVNQLGWSVGGGDYLAAAIEAAGGLPQKILCHGFVTQVNWSQSVKPAVENIAEQARITVANNNIDALSALVQNQVDPEHTLYELTDISLEYLSGAGVPKQIIDELRPISNTVYQTQAVFLQALPASAKLFEQEILQQAQVGLLSDEILEAIQHGSLSHEQIDSLDAITKLSEKIHTSWFDVQQGGVLWELVASNADQPVSADSDASLIEPSAEQINQLMQLNQQQLQVNHLEVIANKQQADLYAIYWTMLRLSVGAIDTNSDLKQRVYYDLELPIDGEPVPDPYQPAREPLLKTVQAANEALEQAQVVLSTLLNAFNLPKTLELKKSSNQRYFRSKDPVLLLSGINRSNKYDDEGRYSNERELFCRFSGQTLNSIEVSTDSTSPKYNVSLEDLADTILILPKDKLAILPDMVKALLQEAFFLDDTPHPELISPDSITITQSAFNIATIALPHLGDQAKLLTVAERVSEQLLLKWNNPTTGQPLLPQRTITMLAGLMGVLPSKRSVQYWYQPWEPLFLNWRIQWSPTTTTAEQPLGDWHYEYDQQLESYVWKNPKANFSSKAEYVGRVLLTPSASQSFKDAVAKLLKESGELPEPTAMLLQHIQDWDVISQNLSGLTDQLVQQYFDTYLPEVDSQYPDIAKAIANRSSFGPPTYGSGLFDPFRMGTFVIAGLFLTDNFGQGLALPIDLMDNKADQIIRGRGMVPSDPAVDKRIIQLPPRIAQYSRLRFDCVDNTVDTQVYQINQASNPICGWLLVNHLDRGIDVYDPAGVLLGELLLVGAEETTQIFWRKVPEVEIEPEQIDNRHLKAFVLAILKTADPKQAFADLLKVIDTSLMQFNPLNNNGMDQDLSALIGKPLALVRTRLQFDLAGAPNFKLDYDHLGKEDDAGFPEVKLPIRLGSHDLHNDGLIGYFLNDDYSQFRTVRNLSDITLSDVPYVTQDPFVSLSFSIKESANTLFATMIWDPRGIVHASTGILPIQSLQLPQKFVNKPLQNLAVTFHHLPVLINEDQLKITAPYLGKSHWTWIEPKVLMQPTDQPSWQEPVTFKSTDQLATLSEQPNVVKEGWLRLKLNQLANK